jgi:dipeptidyl aminopeptidase/acylaminoacyl peptidase
VVALAAPTDQLADAERRGGLSKALQALVGRPAAVDADTLKILQEMSPIYHVRPGLPPFLLIQGTEDKSVLYSQSVNFQARLQESSVPCKLVTLPGAPHRLSEWKKFDPTYKEQMIAWLQQALGMKKD